jgi:phytanoyl-CoA hydroxylase
MNATADSTLQTEQTMQTERYLRDGYLVVADLVSPDQVAEVNAEAVRFARGEFPTINAPAVPKDLSDAEAMSRLLAVHFPHWVSPVVRSMIDIAPIAEVLQRITAAHVPGWNGSVKCMQSMLFVKGPGMPGQAWHQDERFIPTRDRSLIGVWIALDDATVANGCLEVIPGSHRAGYIHPFRPHGRPGEFDPTDEAYGFDDSDTVMVEVSAGSVVFFNGYLLHRSQRNRSDGYRRALVNHYCNAWSLLPWSPLPEQLTTLGVATRDYRNVVPIGPDPYAWKGYGECPDAVLIRPAEGPWGEQTQP